MARILHLSDLHLGPVPFPWREGLKPMLGWINWARKPGAHSADALARTLTAVRTATPDHILLTGDIIELGQASEMAAALSMLTSITLPTRLSWCPGNHDVYTSAARARLLAQAGDWLCSRQELPLVDHRDLFPHATMVDGVAVIALCSGLPTWLFSAEGELGEGQLTRLDRLLARLATDRAFPLIGLHHPPVNDGLNPLQRLRDRDALLAVLARHRCEVLAHGHVHAPRRLEIDNAGTPLTLIGGASASSSGRNDAPAAFNLIEVKRTGQSWCWSVETVWT